MGPMNKSDPFSQYYLKGQKVTCDYLAGLKLVFPSKYTKLNICHNIVI